MKKKIQFIQAMLLAMLLLFIFSTAVFAEVQESDTNAFTVNSTEKSNEPATITFKATDKNVIGQVTDTADDNVGSIHLSDSEKAAMAANSLIPTLINHGKFNGPEWLKRTDFELQFYNHAQPEYVVETIQPILVNQDKTHALFWQGRISQQNPRENYASGTTINMGTGYRWLANDKQTMLGVNTFIDHASDYNQFRWGIGVEYFHGLIEFRSNGYSAISGPRETSRSLTSAMYQQVLNGYDYEIGTSFSGAQWLSVYTQGYHFYNSNVESVNGYKLRATVQLLPRLSLEVGSTHDNLSSRNNYGIITYNLADSNKRALLTKSKNYDTRQENFASKLLQKVVRENNIRIGTYTKLLPASNVVITVNDGVSPLSGASVTLNGQTLTTNSSGQVTFANIVAGSYTILVAKSGYVTKTSSLLVTGEGTASATVALTTLTGDATIAINDGTTPIQGATVSVVVNGTTQSATTNAQGNATFSNLPVSSYTFTATKDGYNTNTANIAVTNGAMATGVIQLTHQIGNATITVQDSSHNLMPGATVTLNGQQLTTGTNGTTTFTNVPTGTYTVSVDKTGYTTNNTGSVTVISSSNATVTIMLTHEIGNATITVQDSSHNLIQGAIVTLNGQQLTTGSNGTITFTNVPTGTYTVSVDKTGYTTNNTGSVTVISSGNATVTIMLTHELGNATITVQDSSHNPIQGATVTLNGQQLTTGSNGTVTFNNVPTGTYTPTASQLGYVTNTGNIVVTNGGNATALILLAVQPGSATIKVTDGTNPVSGAIVTLDGQQVTTDSNGLASFSNVLPGASYPVSASKTGYTPNTGSITITSGTGATTTVALTRQIGNAGITVTDSSSIPMQGAAVTLNGQQVSTDSNGLASFNNVPTGTYTLTVSKIGYNTNTSSSVIVTNGGSATKTVILTHQTGSTTITITDGTTPILGATVTINGQSMATNSSGHATFTNVPTGSYSVSASCSGYTSNTGGVTVTTSPVATTTIILTPLPGNATITVVDTSGVGISGVTVATGGTSGTTDINGQFTFSNLQPGNHIFTATMNDYVTNTATVAVTSSTTATGNIQLTALYKLIITAYSMPGPILDGTGVQINGYSTMHTTDSNGQVEYLSIPAGTYVFSGTNISTGEAGSCTVIISTSARPRTINANMYLSTWGG